MNLNFNDTLDNLSMGIAVNCKQDLSNYDNIEFKIENITYTGYGEIFYYVSNSANDYKEISTESGYREQTTGGILNGVKNINISNEKGEKYINVINYNPAGNNEKRYGSISFDITTIVLK